MTSKSSKQEKFATFVMTGDTMIKTNSILHNNTITQSFNGDDTEIIEKGENKFENNEELNVAKNNSTKLTSSKIIHSPCSQAAVVTKNGKNNSITHAENNFGIENTDHKNSNLPISNNTPRRIIELEIPPDDISAEDEDFKELVANVDDLPPPPEHFFHQSNSSDGFCTFTSIQNGNQNHQENVLFKNSDINSIATIPENNLVTTHKAPKFFHKITACSSEKELIKENAKDILKRSMECDDLKSPERSMQEQLGSQSRVYRSHENYLQMLNPIDLSPMLLEEPGAVSVDALNYEKIESSLNNVEAFLNSNDLCDIIDFSKRNSNIHPHINLQTLMQPQLDTLQPFVNSQPEFIDQLLNLSPNKLQINNNNNDLIIQRNYTTTNDLSINTPTHNQLPSNNHTTTLASLPTNPQIQHSPPTLSHFKETTTAQLPSQSILRQTNNVTKPPTNHTDIFPMPPPPSSTCLHDATSSIDVSCAQRLANRLFNQDGFQPSDVSKHLSKSDPFSLLVGREYLKHFNFENLDLDRALRHFLDTVVLEGETQEKERVLTHFSHQFVHTNPRFGLSEDACHTLVCAMILLNTDHHSQRVQQKMTQDEFLGNLSGLNDLSTDYPPSLIITIFLSITANPLPCLISSKRSSVSFQPTHPSTSEMHQLSNPFLSIPNQHEAREYKKGYVMRKNCISSGGLRTSMGKRGWQMYFVVLRDMVLYLYKDENEAAKASKQKLGRVLEHRYKYIRVHHSLTRVAEDYQKKRFVFRLNTCDQAEYLFQTSDSTQCDSWVEKLNLVAACLSGAPLPSGVGSQKKKFQRPLMPSSYTKFNLREQYQNTVKVCDELEDSLKVHVTQAPKAGRPAVLLEFNEKEKYLEFEIERFKVYCRILKEKMNGTIS